MTLLSNVGGASGPLFGTFFIRAAQKAVFQVLGVLIQRFIAVNVVPLRVALLQHLAEAALLD